MANEFKIMPVAWLIQCKSSGLVEQAEPNEKTSNPDYWTDAFPVFAASPQPPALGGEPEVVGWRDSDGRCITHGGSGRYHKPLIDLEAHRAHLAPLQAKIERLEYDLGSCELMRDIAYSERDQLKARCDEAIRLLRGVHTCDLFGPEDWETVNAFLSKTAGSEQV